MLAQPLQETDLQPLLFSDQHIKDLIKSGEDSVSQSNFDDAERYFTYALSNTNSQSRFYNLLLYRRAESRHDQGKYQLAEEDLSNIIVNLGPDNTDPHLFARRGKVRFRIKSWTEAAHDLIIAISSKLLSDSDRIESLIFLSRIKCFEKAYLQAEQCSDEVLQFSNLSPLMRIRALHINALAKYGLAKYEEAERGFSILLEGDYFNPLVRFVMLLKRARIMRLRGDFAAAQVDYQQASICKISPYMLGEALYRAGRMADLQHKFAGAEDLYTQALSTYAFSTKFESKILFHRGQVRYSQGKLKEALTDFKEALASNDLPANSHSDALVLTSHCLSYYKAVQKIEAFRKPGEEAQTRKAFRESGELSLEGGLFTTRPPYPLYISPRPRV